MKPNSAFTKPQNLEMFGNNFFITMKNQCNYDGAEPNTGS